MSYGSFSCATLFPLLTKKRLSVYVSIQYGKPLSILVSLFFEPGNYRDAFNVTNISDGGKKRQGRTDGTIAPAELSMKKAVHANGTSDVG